MFYFSSSIIFIFMFIFISPIAACRNIIVGGYFGGGGGGVTIHNIGGGGGGSSFLGGCIADESYTRSGSSGIDLAQTLPGGFDDESYVSGSNVGVGGYGSTNNVPAKPGNGGNGRILITGYTRTAKPSLSPTDSPTVSR